MTIPMPETVPPPELHDRLLAVLIPQLHAPNVALLRPILQILAYQSLRRITHSISTKPLQTALRVSTTQELDVQLLCDLIWAYPNHGNAISTILTRRFDAQHDLLETFGTIVIPSLISRLASVDIDINGISPILRALGGLIRAHDDILCLAVIEAKSVLETLAGTYGRLKGGDYGLRIKEDILLVVHRIMGASIGNGNQETIKSFLGPPSSPGSRGRLFVETTLREDYQVVFEGGEIQIPLEIIGKLERFQDERANIGAVQNLISLFPYIPSTLLSQALNHPTYSGSPQPLVEAILAGGFNLPAELRELSKIVANHAGIDGNAESSSSAKKERRNIWQDDKIDMSRLKIKDHSDEAITAIGGSSIPAHLRDSIFRLVENQAIEAEEQERALAEARGESRPRAHDRTRPYDDLEDEEEVSRVRIVGEGDASGDDDTEGDKDKIVDKTRRPDKVPVYDPDLQIKLELAYLTNPAIFDRDSTTRKTEGRMKLKERTGMDDGQLEGWRVMLERNPHKDAILGRHQVIPQEYHIYLPKGGKGKGRASASESGTRSENGGGESSGNGAGRGRGGGGGGGGGRGGRGRGGGESGSGGGGGRGRGGNKGSRGHSNAARTRGHDKKMSRMGAI